jgi:hypothetical protein
MLMTVEPEALMLTELLNSLGLLLLLCLVDF